MEWHHIVEQCQAKPSRSGFSISDINTKANVRATPREVHEAISKYYSTKQPQLGDITVRDWLNGQSYDEQMKFRLEIWQKYMKQFGYSVN